MTIGQKIKKFREIRNFSQRALADELQIAQTTMSKMELDEIDIPFKRLEQIAEILKVRVLDIVAFDEQTFITNYGQQNNLSVTGDNHIHHDKELLTELKKQYEARIHQQATQIAQQAQEIERLHALLAKALGE